MTKKKLPIDVKKLIEAFGAIGAERDLPVFIDIVYDATASDALIAMVQAAFKTECENALIENVVLGKGAVELPLPADLCVVVAGVSMQVGAVAAQARSKGIPAVVVYEKGSTRFSEQAPVATRASNAATVMPGGAVAAGGRVISADAAAADNVRAAQALAPACGVPAADLIELSCAGTQGRPLEALGSWIVANAPAKAMSMAASFAFMRHPMAIETVIANSIQNGAISIVFFMPGADMPAITLNQARMVLELAAVYGQPLDTSRTKELAVVVAGAFGLRGLARTIVRQVPGIVGIPVKAAISASGTIAMGYAAIDYFEEGGVLAAVAEKSEGVYKQANKLMRKIVAPS